MNSNLALWIAGCIILFLIGLYGLMSKRDGLKIAIAIEIMVTAVNAVFIGMGYLYSDQVDPLSQSYTILSLSVGGAIIGVALAMLIKIYQMKGTVDQSMEIELRW